MSKYLKNIEINTKNLSKEKKKVFPFNLPLFAKKIELKLKKPITFLIGENGSGKSTLLEAIAHSVGFNLLGGNKNHSYKKESSFDNIALSNAMKLTWFNKTGKGFFFRAESFFDFVNYVDSIAEEDRSIYRAYGGKSLQKQSHGESFLNLFQNKFRDGLFILDEPEAALSPERQLSLIAILNDLSKAGSSQFIIATHSPFLITVPNSTIYEIRNNEICEVKYNETKQFDLYKSFLNSPERFIRHLCDNDTNIER